MVNYLDFWKSKRVLLTGHSGFKGAWHSVILADLGADVHGVSLDAPSQVNLFEKIGSAHLVQSFTGIDIANVDAFIEIVGQIEPEIVFRRFPAACYRSYTAPRTTIRSTSSEPWLFSKPYDLSIPFAQALSLRQTNATRIPGRRPATTKWRRSAGTTCTVPARLQRKYWSILTQTRSLARILVSASLRSGQAM